jgi:exonuclease III
MQYHGNDDGLQPYYEMTRKNVIILSLNVGTAARDEYESKGKYRFGYRLDNIVEFLQRFQREHQNKIIFICLQELRTTLHTKCPGDVEAWKVAHYISKKICMDYIIAATSSTNKYAEYKATFYDINKVSLKASMNWRPDRSRIVEQYRSPCTALMTDFIIKRNHNQSECDTKTIDCDCSEGTNILEIWNCHLPFPEHERVIFTRHLMQHITSDRAVIIGDFNTIPKQGDKKQLDLLTSKFHHLSSHLKKTFHSFPHDTDAKGNVLESVLDHVFTSNSQIGSQHTKVFVYPWQTKLPGSDHYPISVEFDLHE